MKRTIENPKKVNHELFIILVIYAVMGIGLGQWFTAIDHNKQYEILTGIILNISYGCFASVIVAWIFEVNNVKHENERLNQLYDAAYRELQFQIGMYLQEWSNFCLNAYKNKDGEKIFRNKKFIWMDWYESVEEEYGKCSWRRKKKLLEFFRRELKYRVEKVNQAISNIVQNYNLLRISGFLNDDLENLIRDLEIEFRTLYGTLVDESGEKLFWDSLDAINKDLEKYIGTWKDIEYYNNILFEAVKFF